MKVLNLIQTIFSKRKNKKMEKQEIKTTSYSQPHVLQLRMQEQGLKHGDRVTADLSPVRLEPLANGEMVMYYCPIQEIAVKQLLARGDGGWLPADATLVNITAPKNIVPGLYNLKNVQLYSNGTMQVIATAETEFERY